MEKIGWKITAIITLILLICSLVALVLIFNVGQQYELRSKTCAYDICGIREGEHDSYFYTDVDDTCWCFLKGELDIIEYVEDFI